MDGPEPERGPAKLEDDRGMSFEMAHVGMASRSTTHDVYREGVVIGSVWVRCDADEHAVVDVIVV